MRGRDATKFIITEKPRKALGVDTSNAHVVKIN